MALAGVNFAPSNTTYEGMFVGISSGNNAYATTQVG